MRSITTTLLLATGCGIGGIHSTVSAQRINQQQIKQNFRERRGCRDNPSYVSKLGMTCDRHESVDCRGFINFRNFHQSDVDELLKECPISCDSCPKKRDRPQINHRPKAESDPEPALGSMLSLDFFDSLDDAACHPGWNPLCSDDPAYVSRLGFACDQHTYVDCTKFSNIGFTEFEVYDLITRCPCSCKVPCGEWTMQPTISPQPSEHPTVSMHPSSSPSSSPSSLPSSAPSSSPTSNPSLQPSAMPSLSHSSSPSSAPSASPTQKPTAQHSEVPTSAPSIPPTIHESSAPSGSPSVLASASPSTLPSANPTDMHSTSPSSSPSEAPVTTSPTLNPSATPTTSAPVSSTPTLAPITPAPSSAPTWAPTTVPTNPPSLETSNKQRSDHTSIVKVLNANAEKLSEMAKERVIQHLFNDDDGSGINIVWEFGRSGQQSDGGWSVNDNGMIVRFSVEDSGGCTEGGNANEQKGMANGILLVFDDVMPLYFSIGGMGEMLDSGYESFTLSIDGIVLASATSNGRGLACKTSPARVTYSLDSIPILLSKGMHTVNLQFTTFDGYDHEGVFYELHLSRSKAAAESVNYYAPYMSIPNVI